MNKLLKTTLAGLLLATPAIHAQIELSDNLSVTGFLDMSAVDVNSETGEDTSSFNLDQAEIDFLGGILCAVCDPPACT